MEVCFADERGPGVKEDAYVYLAMADIHGVRTEMVLQDFV